MQSVKYMTKLLTFYLKGEIKSEQNFISFKVPNTILGLIPLGAKKDKVAINQISTVSTDFKLKFGSMLIGIIAAIVGLCLLRNSAFWALVLLIYGASSIINSMQTELNVVMTSGQEKKISFLIFDKKKAELASEQINNMIAGRLDDTNNRQQTDRIVDAIHNIK